MHCNLKCIVTEIQFSITSDKSFEKYRYFILLILEKKKVLQSWLKTSKLSGQVMMSSTAKEANNIKSLAS